MSFLPFLRRQRYDKDFFAGFAETSQTSATIVLGHLFERYRPKSILDVGCGLGAWLNAARSLGVTEIRGLDGPWVAADQLRIPAEAFERIDFEAADWPEVRRVDLALSLEVAEHLTDAAGRRLVKYLAASAPVIAFSAAIPCQGGEGHINERWQSYWAGLFAAEGFEPSLVLREGVWADNRVDLWYQQNLVLYVSRDTATAIPGPCGDTLLDVVHPRLYEIRVIKRARRRAGWRRLVPFLVR